ncbi:hypothetical protein [Luteimonas deserti]|uniref:Secreted protein n=1 Tax=Luteimonas deserti TaxID=2752306 RepID=A0A7Z0QS37_9GAMM|nr:hypothetical protein [Luteimonas deserti]NYZ62760.1 hypothetical protein [Luteimonas deserti]
MIKRLALLLFAAAALTACAAPAERLSANAGPDAATVTHEADCDRVGGEWRQLGRAPVKQCLRRTTDAGKACSQSEQCEGHCLAPEGSVDGTTVTGQCSVDTNPFGCQQRVRDGMASTICVD